MTTNRLSRINVPTPIWLAGALLSLCLLVYGLVTLRDLLVPLVFATVLAVILSPLSARLEGWRVPRLLAVALCIVLVTLALTGLIYWLSVQFGGLTGNTTHLTGQMQQWLAQLQTYAETTLGIDRQRQLVEVRKLLNQALEQGGSLLSSALQTTTSTLTGLAFVLIYTFFGLLYREFFVSFVYRAFAHQRRSVVGAVLDRIGGVIRDYLVGLVTVTFIIGVLNTLGLWVLGVESALFFGFFAALLNLIPYIGIAIGSLVPALFALVTTGNPLTALGVVAVFLGVQALEGNVITPFVVGAKVSVNPPAAIVSLLIWGQLWGLPGLVLALPLTAIVKVLFDATEGLKPFGYLLGAAEVPNHPAELHQPPAERPDRIHASAKSSVES